MYKKLLLLAFLASCAQIQQKPAEHSDMDRDLSSDSCFRAARDIIGAKGDTKFIPQAFDEEVFDSYFTDFGAQFLYDGMNKLMTKDASADIKRVAKKVDLAPSMQSILTKLDAEDKQVLWKSLYAKAAASFEEESLKAESKNGDKVATFLLTVPQGQMREDATTAIMFLKVNEPDLDEVAIVEKVKGRMSACLIK